MRHLDTPGEDMGGRLSRQRGGGAGRGASPQAAGTPSSRHFRLTAPRPSVLSHTSDDQQQDTKTRQSSTSPNRRHDSATHRRSGPGSTPASGVGVGPWRESSVHYVPTSSSSSRRAAAGSSNKPPVSYEDSLDPDGFVDGTATPSSTGGGVQHARRSSAQGRTYFVTPAPSGAGKKQSTGGTSATTSARLHVPELRVGTSAKRHVSSNSDRVRRSGRGAAGHLSPSVTSGGRSQDDSAAVNDSHVDTGDEPGGRCRSAPPVEVTYTRYADAERGGRHREGVYDDDMRHAGGVPGGGRRCVRSPGAVATALVGTGGGVTVSYAAAGATGGSSSPQTQAAAGRGGGGAEAEATRGGVRPTEKAGGQRPGEDYFTAGEGGDTNGPEMQQKRKTGSTAAPSPTSSRIDSSGIIDRSKFILENAGVLTDFYDVDSGTLGQGSYGSVAKARKKHTGQMRAIKTISKSQVKNLERFRQEIAIMKELDHPNVVKLFETFEDHRNIYLVMELCSGGELFDRIISEGRLTEKQAAVLMKQMLSAVHYLHSNHIMHRDLKPENFLFLDSSRDSPLKIIDFGLSCRFKPGECVSTKAGTPYYVAPQVLQGKYDYRCDAWSLGVILYILLCGYPPFYGETDAEVLAKVKAGVYSFSGPEWRRVSDEARDLIRHLIRYNPQERYTAEQALQHPWITTLAQNSQNVALPTTLMSNLKAFRAQNKLKKAALTVIAQHMSEKDINHLRQIFMTLDVDNSGTLSVQEIREGLKRLGWTEIPLDLQAIIEEVDSDRSGHIDYTEFVAATMDKKLYMKEDVCWAAFRVFDLDGNGKISQDELKKVLGMPDVETAVGRATIDALLNEVDLNGDGEIDFDEFMHMMRKKDPPEKRLDLTSRKTIQPASIDGGRDSLRRHTLVRPALTTGTPPPAAAAAATPAASSTPNAAAATGSSSTTAAPTSASGALGHVAPAGGGVFAGGCASNASAHAARTLASGRSPQVIDGDCNSRPHHTVAGSAGASRKHENY